jgi:hypothetical protein
MSSKLQSNRDLAEAIRQACIAAALEAHEQAGVSGLCQEGRWEVAIDAIRSLDLGALLAQIDPGDEPHA